MTADNTTSAYREETLDIGFLSHDFGILIPNKTGVSISKQTGGVHCKSIELTGDFIPLERPTVRREGPDWANLDADDADVTDTDLSTIPDRDYNALPEWIQDRGNFYSVKQYIDWLQSDDVWWYGYTDLIEELKSWNYDPTGELRHSDDMTTEWDGLAQIWEAIQASLPFTYDEYNYFKENCTTDDHPINPDEYPTPCEGVKWITITGSKTLPDGTTKAPWADKLAGETVLLLYPNCD